jgi:Cu-processing system ATP-binding protein
MNVQFRDIQVRFGQVTALGGVSLELTPGCSTVLVGPNGAGKSTMMNVLLSLVRPDAGHVLVDGQPYPGLPIKEREKLGYLPEAVAFPDNLSGREVMRFFARARGVPKARAEHVLSEVGLAQAAGRAVRGYSRGMRQRLGLGVAILSEPELLVLDEPTGGLDQQGLTLLWTVLARWKEAGRTVLVTTHDLTLIERRADQLCVMREGLVQACGSPEELRRLVGLPVRVGLELAGGVAVGSLVAALRAAGLGEPLVRPSGPDSHRLELAAPSDRLLEVLRLVDRYEPSVRHLRVEEPGLDDVYEHILGVAS